MFHATRLRNPANGAVRKDDAMLQVKGTLFLLRSRKSVLEGSFVLRVNTFNQICVMNISNAPVDLLPFFRGPKLGRVRIPNPHAKSRCVSSQGHPLLAFAEELLSTTSLCKVRE